MRTAGLTIATAALGLREATARLRPAIVHAGQHALVFATSDVDRLVVVTSAAAGLMPGGLCILAPAEFAAVRSRHLATNPPVTAGIERWLAGHAPSIDEVDLQLGRRPVDQAAVFLMRRRLAAAAGDRADANDAVVAAGPLRARAPRLARAAAVCGLGAPMASDLLRHELMELIGAGPGTTPAGDDVVVGVLAGLRVVGADRAAETIALGVRDLLTRTTRASRHYLSAACRGEFGEHVHDLVDALRCPRRLPDALDRAAGWGASSGIDLAHGLVAAAAVDEARSVTTERIA